LPDYDAAVLTAERAMAEYVDEAMRAHPDTKAVSNWLMGDFMRLLKSEELTIEQVKLRPAQIGEMLQLIEQGVISGKIAKTVFEEMVASGAEPADIVAQKGLTQVTDTGAIAAAVQEVLAQNPDKVAEFKGGKDKLLGFFVGQVMKATGGKANPAQLNELLKKKLTA